MGGASLEHWSIPLEFVTGLKLLVIEIDRDSLKSSIDQTEIDVYLFNHVIGETDTSTE